MFVVDKTSEVDGEQVCHRDVRTLESYLWSQGELRPGQPVQHNIFPPPLNALSLSSWGFLEAQVSLALSSLGLSLTIASDSLPMMASGIKLSVGDSLSWERGRGDDDTT